MKIIYLIIASILILSCQNKVNKSATETSNPEKLQADQQLIIEDDSVTDLNKGSKSTYTLNEDFANNPFDFELTLENVKEQIGDFETEIQSFKNKHDDSQIDSLIEIKNDSISFVFYRTPDRDILQTAIIKTPDLKLKNNVCIGVDKKEFETVFDIKINTEKIQIGNLENTIVLTFTFSDNKVSLIEYEGYVD